MIERICKMLESCATDSTVIPPTDLYNEGWMLRLVLDWLSSHPGRDTLIPYPHDARWYSEALLPSAFLPRKRGDKLAESWTHADGVVGNFMIGASGQGDLSLMPDAECLIVIEAKMFSKLSPGVTNASYYNQAARNVACIAEVLEEAKLQPANMNALGFFVAAPRSQIDQGVFARHMTRQSIQEIVKCRVDAYEGDRDDWYETWFLLSLERMAIQTVAWEDIVEDIQKADEPFGHELSAFYERCLEFNKQTLQTH